jgi:hypothetical protein
VGVLNVSLILEADELDRVRATAKSLGLSVSAYVRQVVRDSLRTRPGLEPEARDAKLLRAMRALVPTLAEALGKTQNVGVEEIARLSKVLLERYDKEI